MPLRLGRHTYFASMSAISMLMGWLHSMPLRAAFSFSLFRAVTAPYRYAEKPISSPAYHAAAARPRRAYHAARLR